jgi:D-glycero-D-manno-heptose 1,7-bisphosphate phosphatase
MPLTKKFNTLFLDRDGVINKKIDNGYVLNINQIEIIPGITEFIKAAENYFERIIVVTNQRGVGRGLLSIGELAVINDEVNRLTGCLINRFYVCPHLDEDNCNCRKPKEGLFLNAQKDYEIDFQNSWMVGDSESDMIPAKKLGITTLLLSAQNNIFADRRFENPYELRSFLENTDK